MYGVAIDKISGGQVLEREEVSGLSDRPEEMEVFLQKLCQGDAFPMELAELGMTIFLRKNLFTKEETHFIQKQRARISMIFRKIRAFLFAGIFSISLEAISDCHCYK